MERLPGLVMRLLLPALSVEEGEMKQRELTPLPLRTGRATQVSAFPGCSSRKVGEGGRRPLATVRTLRTSSPCLIKHDFCLQHTEVYKPKQRHL